MQIVKAGMLDSFQDSGRKGYAQYGVGLGGNADFFAGKLANILTQNEDDVAVLEMHFPGPVIKIEEKVIVAITGADFGARVNGYALKQNRPVFLPEGAEISFLKKIWGQRAYLAVKNGWKLEKALGSYSTNLKAGFGGFKGRALKKGDRVEVTSSSELLPDLKEIIEAKWFAEPYPFYKKNNIRVMPGPEWDWLTYMAQKKLLNHSFTIQPQSDKMGYLLQGEIIEKRETKEMLSSAVIPGTIQLLPNGNLLLLMSDCQTTGGYPRILQVAAAYLPVLAQMGPGEQLQFDLFSTSAAGNLLDNLNSSLNIIKASVRVQVPFYK